jgi:site-specific recombinase XerD
LRHTAITLLIAAGIDLKTVQEIAGHKDIKTTMGYTHLLAERIKHVAQNFSILPTAQEPKDQPKTAFRLIKGGA